MRYWHFRAGFVRLSTSRQAISCLWNQIEKIRRGALRINMINTALSFFLRLVWNWKRWIFSCGAVHRRHLQKCCLSQSYGLITHKKCIGCYFIIYYIHLPFNLLLASCTWPPKSNDLMETFWSIEDTSIDPNIIPAYTIRLFVYLWPSNQLQFKTILLTHIIYIVRSLQISRMCKL